ncbi:MAG: (d)CMP kinase [Rhizobiales bacterium]|nr:(d)CMP kinase [Hyphomicrobiales bacterium]
MTFVIAIDGPAASGKGTLGRRLAEKYGLHHLDTGLLYRATAAAVLAEGSRLSDADKAVAAARRLDLSALDRATLSSHAIGDAASQIAALPSVRAALLTAQKSFARKTPGAVLDGRDITTVICPDADVKLFVTASPEVRARRRLAETEMKGEATTYEAVLADIMRRDARDSARADAPLTHHPDAHLIDTTEMDIETAFQTACAYVEQSR